MPLYSPSPEADITNQSQYSFPISLVCLKILLKIALQEKPVDPTVNCRDLPSPYSEP